MDDAVCHPGLQLLLGFRIRVIVRVVHRDEYDQNAEDAEAFVAAANGAKACCTLVANLIC